MYTQEECIGTNAPRRQSLGQFALVKNGHVASPFSRLTRFFPSVACRLLRATALIVRENNPFERPGKTRRVSMDAARLRRDEEGSSCARYVSLASLHRNKKHPEAFARNIWPGALIALKVLQQFPAARAASDTSTRSRRN